jgi:CRISPR/Cas system CSM-associated protein Csm3 (group 7 of RAMP superfamily)
MDINYKITFHTYWHCGSGLAAGADVDMLVVKDRDGIPFVPGKTIKGLVREAVDLLYPKMNTMPDYKSVFGIEPQQDKKQESYRSESFFKDATLSEQEKAFIVEKGLTEHLYESVSSTAITDDGIADDNTLRKIQVCVPCELEGAILNVPEVQERGQIKEQEREEEPEPTIESVLIDALKYIKRLGSWRNRGLGRCTFTPIDSKEHKKGGQL